MAAAAAADGTTPAAAPEPEKPKSEELVKAEEAAQQKTAVADQAEQQSKSLDERLSLVDRDLSLARQQLKTAEAKVDNARQARDLLETQYRDKVDAGAPQAELRPLRARLQDAEQRARDAEAEVRRRTDALNDLTQERAVIVDAREANLRQATAARAEADQAQAQVKELKQPLRPPQHRPLGRRARPGDPVDPARLGLPLLAGRHRLGTGSRP